MTQLEIESNALYLLVIEKDGIFQRLAEDGIQNRFRCIMITACGYPNIATRALVATLSRVLPHLVVLGLADYNPFGVELLLTYKFGSRSMSWEGANYHVPDLRWLGLRAGQVYDSEVADTSFETLSVVDDRKLNSLLRLPHLPDSFRTELEEMSTGNKKCDLEALYVNGIGQFTTFIETMISGRHYI